MNVETVVATLAAAAAVSPSSTLFQVPRMMGGSLCEVSDTAATTTRIAAKKRCLALQHNDDVAPPITWHHPGMRK